MLWSKSLPLIVCPACVVHALYLGSVGTQTQCIEVITHLERIIVAKSSVLIKLNKNRRVPR